MISRLIGENLRKSYFNFLNHLSLQILPLKICNHDISKTITARSFKQDQLIEDDEKINMCNLKKSFFCELSPFADLDFENL